MTTPTDENRDLVTVIAFCRAASGKEGELKAALEALVEPTTKEPGLVNYDLHQAVEDSSTFYLYENWASAEDFHTHLSAPHLVDFVGEADAPVDGPLTITPLRRIA